MSTLWGALEITTYADGATFVLSATLRCCAVTTRKQFCKRETKGIVGYWPYWYCWQHDGWQDSWTNTAA
jgi:hypothetical protein